MKKWLKLNSSIEPITETESVELKHKKKENINVGGTEDCTKQGIIRKYDESYLSFGFTSTNDEKPKPHCVICYEKLSNHSMKPSLLKRHFLTKHQELNDKPIEFFSRKLKELSSTQNSLNSFTATNKNALEASYLVSLRIAKTGKPHSIGETLILPAAKDIIASVLGPAAATKINIVSLSNDTVSRRIDEMANDVKEELIKNLKQSTYFALQIDESTDITNFAQLLAYVRYEAEQSIKEEFLFCESLSSHTTANEIFKKIDEFVTINKINWQNCVGICSDGARAMTGKHGGVVTKIREVAPHAKFTHCSIHREALASKKMPSELKTVLEQAVKVINFIKARAINSRMFTILCNEMGSEHNKLLLHSEVRWLSRGKVLVRLFELRQEVQIYLANSEFSLAYCFLDELWLERLAYLADIFGKLNELNSSLQGSSITAFTVTDKINAIVKKIEFMITDLEKNRFESFPTLESFITENKLQLKKELHLDIKNHCSQLIVNFRFYFPENFEKDNWIRDPFSSTIVLPDDFSIQERDQLIEISYDSGLQNEFKNENLFNFWLKRKDEFKLISSKAIQFLMPFRTSYLCETGFSAMLSIKNKYRSRLNLEPNLRLKLTKLNPNIKKLISKKQIHPSH